jgi:tetratricopeptide (TPR) repeat protein
MPPVCGHKTGLALASGLWSTLAVDQKAHFDAALRALSSGNPQAAAEICEKSLEAFPGDANLLCLSARANLALRQYSAAEKNVEEAIQRFPDFALAHETFGDLLLVQGQGSKALSAYQTAMRLDPARTETHGKIDRARDLEKAVEEERARLSARRSFDAELKKGIQLELDGEHQSAEMIYREILTKDPDHVEAARLLAGIAALKKRFRDAEIFLKRVVKNAPDFTRGWVELVNVQREMDKFDEATESAKHVLRLAPDAAESHMVYAATIGSAGDHQAAIDAYRQAIDISPDKTGAITGLAHHQKTLGQTQDAIASYRRAIEIKPDHSEAYWSLANLKTFRFDDDEVSAMTELLEDADLPDNSRAELHNALGLECEGRKDYDRAFEHYAACNVARRPHESYDPVDTESTYDRLIEMFTPSFLEEHTGVDETDVTPILIVGLPRSGSTLVEQILASHSMVDGTHELGNLSRAVQGVRRSKSRRSRFPDALQDIGVGGWRAIGRDYLATTEVFRRGAPFFVDKNPNNFIYAGVLRLALPNAKIINARRHPLDSCFGTFKQLFASGQPFSYDMTEIGEYYLQYQRLMDHWHELMPGFVLDVHYEEVVADLETQVRRILDFCGLPFEEACLRFHETERAVKTASSEQVRRPIYSSSVNLWRNYEPHLDELVHILGSLLKSLPEGDQPALLSRENVD